jgi:hypothetical protein
MIPTWRDWAPAAFTLAGLCLGLIAAIQEIHLQRLAHRDAAAFVNGQPIDEVDVERALSSLGADRRAALTREDRDKVLERLIEDELLAQHAVALGLATSDPNARKILIRSLIDSLVAAEPPPSEAELRSFFDANPDLFRTGDMIAVAAVDGAVPGLPPSAMTIDKLKDYLGAEAENLRAVPVGGVAGPFRFAGQSFSVRVVRRSGGAAATFEQARDAVTARYVVERDGRRLRSYIDGLKRSAKIERLP